MSEAQSISHPFAPVYDKNSKILILGSFPSVKSRENMFYYGNPQNRFWKVLAAVLNNAEPRTVEEKKAFLLCSRIALWDCIHSCEISGSSDASIKNAVPNDIGALLSKASISAVFTNGSAAAAVYKKYIFPTVGISAVPLPSTSPANARCSLSCLTEKWSIIKEYL